MERQFLEQQRPIVPGANSSTDSADPNNIVNPPASVQNGQVNNSIEIKD